MPEHAHMHKCQVEVAQNYCMRILCLFKMNKVQSNGLMQMSRWFARSVRSVPNRKECTCLQVCTLLAAQPQSSQGNEQTLSGWCDDMSVTRPENGELCGSPDRFDRFRIETSAPACKHAHFLAAQPQNSQGNEPNPLSSINLSKMLLELLYPNYTLHQKKRRFCEVAFLLGKSVY